MFSPPRVILLQPTLPPKGSVITTQSGDPWQGYDVISNLQDRGHTVRNLLPGSGLVMAPVLESG